MGVNVPHAPPSFPSLAFSARGGEPGNEAGIIAPDLLFIMEQLITLIGLVWKALSKA